jgi:hypothetical protein
VNGITVDVVSRTEPPHGTYPYTGGQCGGLIPYRFSLDLDKNPVSVTASTSPGHTVHGLYDNRQAEPVGCLFEEGTIVRPLPGRPGKISRSASVYFVP